MAQQQLRSVDGGRSGDGTSTTDLERRLAVLETKLEATLGGLATKADVGELRGDFKGWTLTTTVTLVLGMLTGFTAIGGYLAVYVKPPTPAVMQPVQPITLNISPSATVPAAPTSAASKP